VALVEGDYDRGVELARQAKDRFEELGEEWGVVIHLLNMGIVRRYQGDLGEAAQLHEEALERAASLGNDYQYGGALAQLGLTKLARSEIVPAAKLLRQGLALANQHEDQEITAECVEGLAAISVARGTPGAGARLGGLADAIRQEWSLPVAPEDAALVEPFFVRARRELGDAAFSEAWEEGRASGPNEIIAEILSPEGFPESSSPTIG